MMASSIGETSGTLFAPEDRFGNVDLNFHGSAALTLANNPANDSLIGTLTVSASSGMATFSGLMLDKAAVGESVGVVGLGLVGQLAIAILRASGCRPVGVDLDPKAVELAVQNGCLAFVRDCGDAFLDAYLPIVCRRRDEPYTDQQRAFQESRRGRYVEFNLLYDRGTTFGLKTGGRVESILMSLPPVVRWEYDYRPEPGTREAELYDVYLKPRDWAEEAP